MTKSRTNACRFGTQFFGRIAALRFADGQQFPELLNQALEKGMLGEAIKKPVANT